MQLPPFVRVEFQTFLPTCARGAPNHLFLISKRGLGFKYVHIFHVKQVDALLETGVHNNDARHGTMHIVGATIESSQNLLAHWRRNWFPKNAH